MTGFSYGNWDNFFTGHADNIEKDIHSLSKQADDHTAPPDHNGVFWPRSCLFVCLFVLRFFCTFFEL